MTNNTVRNLVIAGALIFIGYQVTCDVHCAEHRAADGSIHSTMIEQHEKTADEPKML